MWIVTPRDVGRVEFGRMMRDGVIATVIPGHATPADVPASPPIRRHVLGTMTPAGGQVTGLAALWALGAGPPPTEMHVRYDPRRRLGTRRGPLPMIGHAVGLAAPADLDGRLHPSIACPAVAVADALRWAPASLAAPVIADAVRLGLVEPGAVEAA
ncbi:hypothetical protein [uncultured Demequina sp.]|uniref:hypothetical protein n=1 Tax=uncultured Demequina sp. TaxID=693499 RepID=UPI0025CC75B0|nr:hypothetical protein [uncultured Demequina sp.]